MQNIHKKGLIIKTFDIIGVFQKHFLADQMSDTSGANTLKEDCCKCEWETKHFT